MIFAAFRTPLSPFFCFIDERRAPRRQSLRSITQGAGAHERRIPPHISSIDTL
jgi:hypothetical protein